MKPSPRAVIAAALLVSAAACGARSSLLDPADSSGAAGGATSSTTHASSSAGPSSGTGPCVPSEEICDGVDNDCDGQIDETDPDAGAPCTTSELGACAEGALSCVDGALACTPVVSPMPEQCNGVDDDCDGVVDDGILCGVKRVFVTSQVYGPDLGGLAGADAKCQALADAAGLGGAFKAWLSDSKTDARDRLTHVGDPYTLADGVTVVAVDWAHFVDTHNGPPLEHPIDRTETMTPAPTNGTFKCGGHPSAWTGTHADGTLQADSCDPTKKDCYTCSDWMPPTNTSAQLGDTTYSEGGWSGGCNPTCAGTAALYCLEQ